LATFIEHRIDETQREIYLERIAARIDIKLGPISLDADGITRSGKQLGWRDAELGAFIGGGFSVRQRGAGVLGKAFGGIQVIGGQHPSPFLQYQLCRTMIERART
jgi:hypothetical protein